MAGKNLSVDDITRLIIYLIIIFLLMKLFGII